MKREILIVGRGGQGVLLLGRLLGLAASKYAGLYAVATETYASEIRGGESRSDVVVGDSIHDIDYVKVQSADIAVFMYPYRVEEYIKLLKPSSIVFIDEEYVEPRLFGGYKLYSHRYSELAEVKLATRRVANIIIAGHIVKVSRLLDLEHLKKTIVELVPEKWHQINIKALELGYSLPA
ncbi:MAG: 2-oxoacid:acceptor oxidoreductase family protein [Desulfurococcus sp.]|nr:2-oxoacid:acceptor oxidoreductase family protein [Desulfurococcus sp.]